MNLKHAQIKVIELQKATASVMRDLINTEDKNIDDLINENKQTEQEEDIEDATDKEAEEDETDEDNEDDDNKENN